MIALLIWCVLNTIIWKLSHEPYHFMAHFLFIPFIYSKTETFHIWIKSLVEKCNQSVFPETHYKFDYIRGYIYRKVGNSVKIDIRRKKDLYVVNVYYKDDTIIRSVELTRCLCSELKYSFSVRAFKLQKNKYIET